MSCTNCYSAECEVEAASNARWEARKLFHYGQEYDRACVVLESAEDDCRRRASAFGLVERVGALEATLARLVTLLENSKGEGSDG